MSSTISFETAVGLVISGSSLAVVPMPTRRGISSIGAAIASWTSTKAFSSLAWKSEFAASNSSGVISPRPTKDSRYKVLTERLASIRLYIRG
jgi:hypothetical protein